MAWTGVGMAGITVLCNVFIDFKKAFHKAFKGLASSFVGYHEEVQHQCANLIRVIQHLYDKATSAVIFNGRIGDGFRTTVRVRQGCLLSPTPFNIFLERITTDALEYHKGTVRRRQNNCKPPLCWWHWWLRRRWRRTGKFGWASWQSLHSWQHIDQCQEDQADDKQHQWHQHS